MVDEQLIRDRFTPEQQAELAFAFKILHTAGIFPMQAEENSKRFAESFQTEQSEEELAKEILQVRQTNRQLLALHELAKNMKEGIE